MARFTDDIFISYAHADNRDGWVDAFHIGLENRLGVFGVEARIWRDKKLSGADIFSDEILDQLKHSALPISILSPNGMRSNWCEKERQRRNRPFAAEAIYFSRPPRREKGQYRTHLDFALEQFQGFQPEAMRPFLDRLCRINGVADP
jgi:hypothetical protein